MSYLELEDWHHRPDRLGVDEKTLRNVFFRSAFIGRIMMHEHGPRAGQWNWTGSWSCLIDGKPVPSNGTTETREDALAELKATCIKVANETPLAVQQMLERDFRVRHQVEDYIAALQAQG